MKCPYCDKPIHVYLAIPDQAVRCRKATKARTSAELAREAGKILAEATADAAARAAAEAAEEMERGKR